MRTISDLIWQERDDAREQAMDSEYEYEIEKLTLEEFFLSEGIPFNYEFTDLHWNALNRYDNYIKYVTLTEDFMRQFQFRIDWGEVSWSQTLSYSFIREFKDRVCWTGICGSHQLTEAFIEEFQEYVDWNTVAEYQTMSEQFVRRFHSRIDHMVYIAIKNPNLSESFLREFHECMDWGVISRSQKLSEAFMEEFHEHIHWNQISKHQQLSESFIRRFIDLLDIESIFANQKLSMDFITEFGFRVEPWRRQMAITRVIQEWMYNQHRNRIERSVRDSLRYNIPMDVILLVNSYLS